MRTVRTGRREVFWLEQRAASPDRLWVIPPEERDSLELTVLPTTHRLATGAAAVPAGRTDRPARFAPGR